MNYTLATTEAIGRDQVLDISKDGNKFTVGIWDREEHTGATKTFENLEEAIKVYTKFVNYFIKGLYSNKDRLEMLKNA